MISVACFTPAGVVGVASVSCGAQIVWYGVLVPLFAARILESRARDFYLPTLKSFLAFFLGTALVFMIKTVSPVGTWLSLGVMGGVCLVICAVTSFLCIFGKPKLKI